MIWTNINDLFFIILISLYLIDQLAYLNKSILDCSMMSLVQDRKYFQRECLFIALLDYFSSSKFDNKLFDQFAYFLEQTFLLLNFLFTNILKRTCNRFLK